MRLGRALSVLVTVGETDEWVGGIIERAKKLKIGNGFAEGVDVYACLRIPSRNLSLLADTLLWLSCMCSGPVISPAAKQRIEGLIASCEEQGGQILLDGRNAHVEGYPDGNWVGPTLLEATTEMDCYK